MRSAARATCIGQESKPKFLLLHEGLWQECPPCQVADREQRQQPECRAVVQQII